MDYARFGSRLCKNATKNQICNFSGALYTFRINDYCVWAVLKGWFFVPGIPRSFYMSAVASRHFSSDASQFALAEQCELVFRQIPKYTGRMDGRHVKRLKVSCRQIVRIAVCLLRSSHSNATRCTSPCPLKSFVSSHWWRPSSETVADLNRNLWIGLGWNTHLASSPTQLHSESSRLSSGRAKDQIGSVAGDGWVATVRSH